MPQPIYIIHKEDFNRIVPLPRSGWTYGLYFGRISSPEAYQEMLDEIVFDEHDTVLVSKAMEAINKRFTYKLMGGANGALIYLKKRLNDIRKPKQL